MTADVLWWNNEGVFSDAFQQLHISRAVEIDELQSGRVFFIRVLNHNHATVLLLMLLMMMT